MKTLVKKVAANYSAVCLSITNQIEKHANKILFAFGVILVSGGLVDMSHAATQTYSNAKFQDDLIRGAVANLFKLIEGAFGALIMVVSGLGAIVAAAMGAYRAAVGMLVVAVGAFILRALVSLFFGTDFTEVTPTGAR